ncbi:sodium-coupled neutral amino acid transporter 9-like [Anarrhichthys ocellatus]|uniref:sodium-coupled neutral amino acid transporter 9-like n=1 Tax=Anarrhichthys ocellatus TaxID=433405 RepID=UPI0012ED6F74|nr:sodium-coupled neutral amino acid transporter 9-like [Anarrhichthys ocellatus]XP_031694323.1 sodium-coupled neutral amino acid transporter 9-like [Anarrhichthys ocellatus]
MSMISFKYLMDYENCVMGTVKNDMTFFSASSRPFHVEPRNIVGDDPQERVSAEAAILNSRVHYYSRLTASSDRLLSPPNHVIPGPEELYIYSPLGTAFKVTGSDPSSKNPSIITIFAIWNTMMGTSILSIPWGIKQAGFTLGVLILIFTGLLMLYCCYIVLKSPKSIPYVDASDWEFPDVCRYYFGKFGQWSSLVFSMVSLIGAMVVYWVLMSNFLYNSGQFIYNYVHNVNVSDSEFGTNGSDKVICPFPNTNPGGNSTIVTLYLGNSGNETSDVSFDHWWSKTNTVPLYLITLLLPLLCFRSASFFARFTFLGTISVVYLIVLVTIKAVHLGFHLEFHWFDTTQFYVPEFRLLFPQFTGVLTLAFFIHNCIITLMKSNKHQENNVRDLSVAYLLVGLTYLYVGVLIFAAFPSPPLFKDCIEPNFLDNFPSSDVMVFVARTFLLFQMITVYPLLGYLVRVQVMGQIFGNHYPSFFHVLALNILIVGSGVLMAKFYPNIGSIIRFSGATCGLALVFVFPALVHMISLRRQGVLRWPSALFHSFLILLGMANLLAQFFM